jgi:MFS family permease
VNADGGFRRSPAAVTDGASVGSVAVDAAASSTAPARSGLVLTALILVAAVANLNLAVANVALPDIGKDFDASQTSLNLVAVGYSLGLAASVLYLGALGDRYGRKLMLVLGVVLAVPASLLAAWSPSVDVLGAARLLGGISAGLAFPTTLALITALWSGSRRTKSIALWSGVGGAIASLGPLVAGAMLDHFWWGSVFLITLPLAAVALVMAVVFVPSHVHETTEPVDNLGGILSVVLVAALVLAINLAAAPDEGALAAGLTVVALAAGTAFSLRPGGRRRPPGCRSRGRRGGDHPEAGVPIGMSLAPWDRTSASSGGKRQPDVTGCATTRRSRFVPQGDAGRCREAVRSAGHGIVGGAPRVA